MVDAAATEEDMILFGGETFDVSLGINSDVFSKVKVPNGSNVSFFREFSGIFLMSKIGT